MFTISLHKKEYIIKREKWEKGTSSNFKATEDYIIYETKSKTCPPKKITNFWKMD